MLIAALEQVLSWNLDEVQAYCRSLTHDLFGEMGQIGFAVEDPAWRSAHLFGLHAPAHVDITTVAARLREQRVFVSLRGSAIRVSPHVYNVAADIAALTEVLRAQARVRA